MRRLPRFIIKSPKVLAKGFSYLLGALAAVVLAIAAALVAASYLWSQPSTAVPLVDATGDLSKVFDAAKASTLTIRGGGGKLGRAHVVGSLHLTNEHVVTSIFGEKPASSPGNPSVSLDFAEVRSYGDGESKGTIQGYDVRSCSEWLDVCVMEPRGFESGTSKEWRDSTAGVTVGQDVYLLPNDIDFTDAPRKLIVGKVEAVHGPFADVAIHGRHGYSGSPMFDGDGKVVGYLSQGLYGPGWKDAFAVAGGYFFGRYTARHRMTLPSAVDVAVWCDERGSGAGGRFPCYEESVKLLVAESEYAIRHRRSFLDRILFHGEVELLRSQLLRAALRGELDAPGRPREIRDLLLATMEEGFGEPAIEWRRSPYDPGWMKAHALFNASFRFFDGLVGESSGAHAAAPASRSDHEGAYAARIGEYFSIFADAPEVGDGDTIGR